MAEFVMLEINSSYNAIIGHLILHAFKEVPSTYHQCLYFPANGVISTVYRSQSESRIAYRKATKITNHGPQMIKEISGESIEGVSEEEKKLMLAGWRAKNRYVE